MDNYKIKVKDEAESKEAQELFVQLGYELDSFFGNYESSTKWVLACTDGSMGCASDGMAKDTLKEITFHQLRDLVAQSKSNLREYLDSNDNYKLCLINPSEAAHWMIEVPEGADCLMQWTTGHKVFYRDNFAKSWNSAYREWQFVSGDDGIDQSSTLWKRATQDPALISGDVALANVHKCIVQYLHDDEPYGRWTTITDHLWSQYHLGMFLDPDTKFKFRFKPQTIKLELELPKPFEPQMGDRYWIIHPAFKSGYTEAMFGEADKHQSFQQFGAYRTEDDVKKAVEQLRKIRGTNS